MSTKKSLFDKRKLRNRLSIKKNIGNKLRLSVFRSNKHIYCQIIDDVKQITLCSSSTLDPEVKKDLKGSGTIDAAEKVGKDIAAKAKASLIFFSLISSPNFSPTLKATSFGLIPFSLKDLSCDDVDKIVLPCLSSIT